MIERLFISSVQKELAEHALSLRGRANFEDRYLKPALATGFIEPTLPTKPRSRFHQYRLTAKGRAWLAATRLETHSPVP